jgi:hypothetical protein
VLVVTLVHVFFGCRQRERVKHQVAAQQKQRAQTKRKYIASEAAPNAAFQAKLEASGGIVPVSSLAKNKLDFAGRQPPPAAAAANGAQHTRFDDSGNPIQAETAAQAGPSQGAGSNKSAAQLLREKLKVGSAEQPAVKVEGEEQQQDSGPVPEPSPKRVKRDGSQESEGDKDMSDAVSPSAAAAAGAENGAQQEADGAAGDGAALPEDEVSTCFVGLLSRTVCVTF